MRIILNFEQEVKPPFLGEGAWCRRTVATRWEPLSANTHSSATAAARYPRYSRVQLTERGVAHPHFLPLQREAGSSARVRKIASNFGKFLLAGDYLLFYK